MERLRTTEIPLDAVIHFGRDTNLYFSCGQPVSTGDYWSDIEHHVTCQKCKDKNAAMHETGA